MKKYLLILCVLLSACSTPLTTYVPVAVQAKKPALNSAPKFPKLNNDATPPQFVKWCVVSHKMCMAELKECRKQIESV